MVKFGVIGDMGTGGPNQYKVAKSLKRMINREKLSGVKDKLRRAERILVIKTLSSLSKIVYFAFQVFGEEKLVKM